MKMQILLLLSLLLTCCQAEADDDRIQPYKNNLRYWQYQGKPVLLLGGTKDDNLFQIPDVKEHLDLLSSVGGNYIRCVMSSRKARGFEVQPFRKLASGKHDLNQWNDDYWKRFDQLLKLTHERKIIVQVEVWAFHDFFDSYVGKSVKQWSSNPWHPDNNVNYALKQSGLKQTYGAANKTPHDFFFTVPKLKNSRIVLKYQQQFIERILKSTLRYDHVLYCMTNEIHPLFPPEWGWYWATYIQQQAKKQKKQVETSEMYWQPNFKHKRLRNSIDQPEIFTFFEASQNSALSKQKNWDNLQHVWHEISDSLRPINHDKIYGADSAPSWAGTSSQGTARFWRNMIGGSASSRFHRPPTGLGLSKTAQAHIRSMRMLTSELDLFRSIPDSKSKLLLDRKSNEAFLTRIDNEQYAIYFPNGGSVQLDLSKVKGTFRIKWLDISKSQWEKSRPVKGKQNIKLTAPGKGHWAAFIIVSK